MKHVISYSGGMGSWGAARRMVDIYGPSSVVLVFTDTRIEDEDLYRFLGDSVANLGCEFVELTEGRTPWEVFAAEKYLGNSRVDPCSKILKRETFRRWLESTYTPEAADVSLGLDFTEEHRFTRALPHWAPWTLRAPLCEAPAASKLDVFDWASKAGLRRPRLYDMGFAHNNCGGFCIKSGKSQFKLLLEKFPERFLHHEQNELNLRALLGKDVTILREQKDNVRRGVTLRELRERWQEGETCPTDEWGGCNCFSDFEGGV